MMIAKKIISTVFFVLVPLSSMFLRCLTTSDIHPKHISDIGNPMIDSEKCGRKGIRSHVCDPDGLITVEQAFLLDDIINRIYNRTVCPCAMSTCRFGDGGGYIIGVAMIRKMILDQATQYRSDSDPEYSPAILNRARLFASKILNNWAMGRCGEDILIFYSMLDNVIYIVTNTKSRSVLPDLMLGNILRDASFKMESRTKESITEGLKFILLSIRDPLQGIVVSSSDVHSSQNSDDGEN